MSNLRDKKIYISVLLITFLFLSPITQAIETQKFVPKEEPNAQGNPIEKKPPIALKPAPFVSPPCIPPPCKKPLFKNPSTTTTTTTTATVLPLP
ncbi:hypothetical protein RND81_01G008600 [Saponaria officinalis]|uniref:Uncharacterized protein n=1 Tax=Saponaria officinalis TaxID=3572 RepID=A0AAW1NAR7_SAPOF